ncbi:MAG TPA: LysR family transcriptional regulator [Albitalea sp.]|uniref:LysR family transcriptional regulator n=1 Tax=Piscinibacter sp. TaxID=1903157 RepID=UPI002ED479A7
MNHRNFDLNLLPIFQAVFVARNVRRAAEQLGMSQPAVSHGLTRLRLRLKDPLFVRTPGGVTPTPRAEHFARSVETALAAVGSSLTETERFDPEVSDRRFVMHMSDLGQGEFLPVLMEHLRTHGPRLRVEAIQLPLDEVLPALERNRIDLALGHLPDMRGTEHQQLIEDRYVLVTRARHPLAETLGHRRTLDQLEYVVAHSHPEPARALVRLGLGERVRLVLPHYSAVTEVLARTDLAAIVPQRPAMRHARQFALAVAELKVDLPPMEIWAHWYWRMNDDAGHRWLRETLAQLYREAKRGRDRRR